MMKLLKNKNGFTLFEVVAMMIFFSLFALVAPFPVDKKGTTVTQRHQTESTKQNEFYIKDNANLLSGYASDRISEKSKQLDLSSKAQIVIETLPSTNGQDIEGYSSKRFKELELNKKFNNGVLIVIALKEKVACVEVGYGLNEILSNDELDRIVREKGLTRFEAQDFEKGITDTYFAIVEKISKEYKPSTRKGYSEYRTGITVKWK